MICTLSSTPVQRNQSSIVNAAFLLAAVKNSTRVHHPGGVRPLYKRLFPAKNHQFEPCFGVANQVAPLLRFGSRTSTAMAEKADPVIEIVEDEEEEWPEAGAQNVAEAEQYQDKINNIFDTLSILIHQDTKTALSDTIQNFKKVITKQWDSMGAADTDVVLRTIKDPDSTLLTSTSNRRGRRGGGPPLKRYHLARNSYANSPRGSGKQKRRLSLLISSTTQGRHTNTWQRSVQTWRHWQR